MLAMDLDRLTGLYNSSEPFIWYGVALAAWPALRSYASIRQRAALVVLLIAFGTSDFFETEAWWKPWWLLAWKAGALAALAGVLAPIVRNYRTRSRASIG